MHTQIRTNDTTQLHRTQSTSTARVSNTRIQRLPQPILELIRISIHSRAPLRRIQRLNHSLARKESPHKLQKDPVERDVHGVRKRAVVDNRLDVTLSGGAVIVGRDVDVAAAEDAEVDGAEGGCACKEELEDRGGCAVELAGEDLELLLVAGDEGIVDVVGEVVGWVLGEDLVYYGGEFFGQDAEWEEGTAVGVGGVRAWSPVVSERWAVGDTWKVLDVPVLLASHSSLARAAYSGSRARVDESGPTSTPPILVSAASIIHLAP